jgi:hypothetical protein
MVYDYKQEIGYGIQYPEWKKGNRDDKGVI